MLLHLEDSIGQRIFVKLKQQRQLKNYMVKFMCINKMFCGLDVG